ncbi:hypothetical protein KEM48_007949, partial [Puccinia striiformis f. sp. tritici PST-130]
IEDLASKRSVCQTADDVCQSSNFINHKSNSDFALPSELPLDHQTSRSNNEKRTSPQNPDTTLSKSNERSRSRLLERITSPFKGIPPAPPITARTRIREIDAFEYKAAIETRGLETVPKLTSKNYRDWQSRMSYFLKSQKIYDVCTIEQEDPP